MAPQAEMPVLREITGAGRNSAESGERPPVETGPFISAASAFSAVQMFFSITRAPRNGDEEARGPGWNRPRIAEEGRASFQLALGRICKLEAYATLLTPAGRDAANGGAASNRSRPRP